MQTQNNRNLVAVAVPLTEKDRLSPEEEISIKHLETYLGRYDRYLIEPQGMNFRLEGFGLKEFESDFFGSVKAHRKMLFSEKFYKSFQKYRFVLIYHTDALVFSDQLEYWCEKNYDYIAPPWIPHNDAPYAGLSDYEGKVGNGGFSLRRIDGFLDVLNSRRLWRAPLSSIKKSMTSTKNPAQIAKSIANSLKLFLPAYNGVRQELNSYTPPEDHFWANRAKHYSPKFRIAPMEIALQFAFECVPRFCYQKNHHKLPFGCHAWARYDKNFWTPFLLT